MNIEEFREYCLSKKATSEGEPFGPGTIVFKVLDKMFAATSTERMPFTANLKCDPEKAEQLREQYPSITPGYHMNKKHWNTIILESEVDNRLIRELVDHSYELAVSGLKKADKEALA